MVKGPHFLAPRLNETEDRIQRIIDDWKDRARSGLSGDAKLAAEKIEKILDESGLTNEQKITAVKAAANQLGVPMSINAEGTIPLRITTNEKPTHFGYGRSDIPVSPQRKEKLTFDPDTIPKSITSREQDHYRAPITFTDEQIPSVTEGKSRAMDFASALMQGNPEAQRIAQEALRARDKEQSLADLVMSSTYEWSRYFNFSAKQEKAVAPIINHYRQAMRQAHRFQLDNEFTQYATEVSNNTKPEKLLYRLQFATLPYETTWIEFNLHVKVRTMRAFHGLSGVPAGVGQRMGILLKRIDETAATVEMFGEQIGDEITAPCLHGYVYSLDERTLDYRRKYNGLTPFSLHRRAALLKGTKDPHWEALNDPKLAEVIDQVGRGALWGYGDMSGVIELSDLRHLRTPPFLMQHGEVCFSPFYDYFETTSHTNLEIMQRMSRTIDSEIAEFAGMMRWIVTVLAMLNEVPTRTEFAQPSHMIRAGLTRRLPAFDYHRITLKLPKTKPVPYLERHLANVERKHRAHMVREHWRTYLSERPCPREEHDWTYDYENGYRLCGKCDSHSRLIHEHERGDRTLGWVQHDYLVKKGAT